LDVGGNCPILKCDYYMKWIASNAFNCIVSSSVYNICILSDINRCEFFWFQIHSNLLTVILSA
jgi:hypothetical protein